jgi:hypothetical protein
LGIGLLFFPLIAAEVIVIFGGVLATLFGIGLIAMAWRLYQGSKSASAA